MCQHRDVVTRDCRRVLGEQLEPLAPANDPHDRIVGVAVAVLVMVVAFRVLGRVIVTLGLLAAGRAEREDGGERRQSRPPAHSNSPSAARSAISARFAASARPIRRISTDVRYRCASTSSMIDRCPSR